MTRLIVLPRWGGHPDSDWYPWIRREAEATGLFDEVTPWSLPDPDLPVIADCVQAFLAKLGSDPVQRADTMVVAHSVGAQVVLRALAAELDPYPLRGVVAVAGWFRVDDIRETSAPWAEPIHHLGGAVVACGRLVNLVSDNEPMIRDWWANAWAWMEAGAHVKVVPGRGHFMEADEPAVWDALLAMAQPGDGTRAGDLN